MSDSVITGATPVVVPGPAVSPTQPKTDLPVQPTNNIDKFASKFAALTRKEREFSATQKQREEDYTKRMAEIQEKQSRFAPYEGLDTEIQAGNKRKALDFLLSKGISAEELTEMLVEEMNPDQERKTQKSIDSVANELKKEILALREELGKKDTEKEEKARKQEEERVKLQHDETINKVLNQLTSFVNGNESDYTLIKQYNSVDLVYETMQAHYDEQTQKGLPEGEIKILSYKEACDNVEEYLASEVKRTYDAKWNRQVPKQEQPDNKLAQTLTNTLSSEVPKSGERTYRSDDESKAAAAKLLRWQE